MIRALYTAATGLEAQQLNIDVIANNLANVSTSGFKKSRADFQDLLYQTTREPGGTATSTGNTSSIQVSRSCGWMPDQTRTTSTMPSRNIGNLKSCGARVIARL